MVFGLLVTNTPFVFMAMLGAMGLSSMMMKNAIVLLDEIKQKRLGGMSECLSIQEAAVTRLHAVAVTATKIALGLLPMFTDIFWSGLAVTIIFGISIGAVLTLIGVPVLYSIFFKVKP
jgi:multidrug efflux pump subunit AcrB